MSGTLVAIALYLLGMPLGWVVPDFDDRWDVRRGRLVQCIFWPLCALFIFGFLIWEAVGEPHLPFNPRNYEDEDIT